MHRFLLLALVSTFIFCGPLPAQRGRILKRLRDDIFGNQSPDKDRKPEKTSTPTPADAKQPTLANPLKKPIESQDRLNTKNRYPAASSVNKKAMAQANGPKKRGFGMSVKLNGSDDLIVASVDANGNAAEAGIRRGDQVLEFGGMEATTVEEFDEIAKVMSAGDQLELRYRRGGKSEKVLVQFGDAPEPVTENVQSTRSGDNLSAPKSTYDFAPPQRDPGGRPLRSVLDEEPTRPNAVGASYGSRKQIDVLQRTVQTQQQTIRQLQKEIMHLRQTLGGRR